MHGKISGFTRESALNDMHATGSSAATMGQQAAESGTGGREPLLNRMAPMLATALALLLSPAATAEAADNEFLVRQAVDFYCGSMKSENPGRMTDYDRGLYEGMAIGFIFGQYPKQADFVEKLGEDRFNGLFYGGIRKQCPSKSFD